jgi:2-oxoglutarate dehydrogenase E1 component
LIDLTPKSLLRHPKAASSLSDLSEGRFHPVLDDPDATDRREEVKRLILCSGKVAIDLATTAATRDHSPDWVAVARVELLYPFPARELENTVSSYPNLRGVVWLQEEPANMGAWSYMAPRLREILPQQLPLRYIGRPERASTAEGSPEAHAEEQERILREAFGGERLVHIETHGVEDVS